MWPRGLNAESRQQITSRNPRGSKRGFAEGRYVGYRMIGGQHKEQTVRIGMAHMQCRDGHRGCGIASGRLQNLHCGPDAEFIYLFCN